MKQEEIREAEENISYVLSIVDKNKIGKEYKTAIESGDREKAVFYLAEHFRNRPECKAQEFVRGFSYNKEVAEKAVNGTVTSIGIEHTFKDGNIDFLFNPTNIKGPVNYEWLWQLNRHAFWRDMAGAYSETGDEKFAKAFNRQLRHWILTAKCPEDYNGVVSAWRTIECGIRLLGSWQTAFEIFRHSREFTDENLIMMVGSMYKQAEFLTEHFTGINWVIMEAVGTYTFTVLFPELAGAENLRKTALIRLAQELEIQILPDGFHNELSPDYFCVVYSCYMGMCMLAKNYGLSSELPLALLDKLKNAAKSAVKLSTPCFTMPRTNDCYTIETKCFTENAEKIFPECEEFRFVNSNRKDGKPINCETASYLLPYAGYCVMRNSWDADSAYLCFDVGPAGASQWHAHMDKLNIILFKGKDELLFDDGGGHYEKSPMRIYGRSSFDHNVVIADGLSQQRKEPACAKEAIDCGFISNSKFDYAFGVYDDGFGEEEKRLAVHKREVRFCKPDFFAVVDTLTSRDGNTHSYEARFHTDTATVSPCESFKGGVLADLSGEYDLLIIPLDEGAVTNTATAQKEPTYAGWYVGRNDKDLHPATTVMRNVENCRDYTFINLLFPIRKSAAFPTIEKLSDSTYNVVFGKNKYVININELNR